MQIPLSAQNRIALSLAAIITLKPTFTEFHELTHWKAYFRTSQLELNSVIHGFVDTGGASIISEQGETNQGRAFSLEEFQAHLLSLSLKLRKIKQTEDSDLIDDLAYEIKSDLASLQFYGVAAKKLVKQYFKRSIFSVIQAAPLLSVADQPSLTFQQDIIEAVNFDWIEQLSFLQGSGSKSKARGLEYQFTNYGDLSWIYLMIPLPKSLQGVDDFRILNRPEYKKAYVDTSKAVHYKMLFLLELFEYIENLDIKISSDETATISPLNFFNNLNRRYQKILQQL